MSCLHDADCTLAANGRCVHEETTWSHSTQCFYGCATDGDCGADALCECLGGQLGQCVEARCRSDADCDSGQLCFRLPHDASGPAWACTRNDDECHVASDCPQAAECFAGDSGSASGTRCVMPMAGTAGTPGRPFLVGGHARTSTLVPREDWCQRLKPRLAGMSAERRRILGEYWTRVALLEHASIAAFLRFSLELLAVGAPHAFLDDATRAIADETRHARLAFGLATAYLGYGVGAGELSAPDALDRFDLRTVTVETLLSGCIGETLAAIAASEALERCEDETVRNVLVEIVRDETRHAKLAWRFVQWAIATDPMLLDELLELTEVERSRLLTREWLPPPEHRPRGAASSLDGRALG